MENKKHGGSRPGSGRKTLDGKPGCQGNRSKRIHVTLSASQMRWVETESAKLECTVSEFVRLVINDAIFEGGDDDSDKVLIHK